ncbi:MAG TPA: tryptophan--tRNA ligase [Xanthomonadales bacterium]|nr:tryptophan--tRNA ligase [Xanthomonadales bacterium]
MTTRVLTGIKPTGTPHLGNYVGAIRPAIATSVLPGIESYYFLADYHALSGSADAQRVHRSTLEVAATWLALGLDPARVYFYRQSDLPEVTELTWLLSCVTAKGLLNRAHAYKAAVDANIAAGNDADHGIGMGLYLYPVLMAADILLFNAHRVPVGRDQIQHIEIARDLAQRFNHLHGEHFTLPEAAIEEHTAVLPGLDGRKMSKSYDNVIPLWGSSKTLRDAIYSVVTNSQLPGEAKDPDDSSLFLLYKAFASVEQTAALRQAYADGIAWGEAKRIVHQHIDAELAPSRERYQALIARPQDIEQTLREGAQRLRPKARALLDALREAVGLRSLARLALPVAAATKTAKKVKLPRFVQFKDSDGRLNFKFMSAEGELLLTGIGYVDAKASAGAMAGLRAASMLTTRGEELWSGDELIGKLQSTDGQVEQTLARLRAALAELNDAESAT